MIRQLTYIGKRIFDITTVHPSKTGDYSTEGVRFRASSLKYVNDFRAFVFCYIFIPYTFCNLKFGSTIENM